ncbi:hypothetical protein JCM11251_007484 [Rhodosporidiobolus azoricus]
MSTPAKVPLLQPPQLRFPTRFVGEQQHIPPMANGTSWPEEGQAVEGPEAAGGGSGGGVAWQLKTDQEEHVERLEARLNHLRSHAPTTGDSPSPSGHLPSFELGETIEEEEPFAPVEEEDALTVGVEEEEGQALLSSVQPVGVVEQSEARPSMVRGTSRTSSLEVESQDEDADASGNDEENSRSRLPHRLPPNVVTHDIQRISFNNSVRIGGTRGGHHSHRHPPFLPQAVPTERTSLLAPQSRPVSGPSPLLVASVTASSPLSRSLSPGATTHRGRPSSSPSRSTSPGPSRASRPSFASSHMSSSHTYLHQGSIYSTSPASYAASRSSSPCSSIYAPLQLPSKTCPNPMYVRPAGALRGIRRSRSGSVLSFQDFLRNGGRFPEADDEDSDDEDEDEMDEPERLDYRDLVEQQRQKKARWEARRKAKEAQRKKRKRPRLGGEGGGHGFWDRLAALLALGIAGSSSGRGSGTTVNVLVAPPSPVRPHRTSSPSRPSPLRRPPSNASMASASSVGGDSSSTDDDQQAYLPIFRRRPPDSSFPGGTTKSEADVRFGPAPRRYFTRAWVKHKVRLLIRAVKRAWATARKGWERAMGERRLAVEEGYEEV